MGEIRRMRGDELEKGVPPGVVILWVQDKEGQALSGYLLYGDAVEAIRDLPNKLLEYNGVRSIVNAKSNDGLDLHIWALSATVYHKPPASEWCLFKPWTW